MGYDPQLCFDDPKGTAERMDDLEYLVTSLRQQLAAETARADRLQTALDIAVGLEFDETTIPIFMPAKLHPDTKRLVAQFAWRMAIKLYRAEQKYGYSDGWKDWNWMEECQQQLLSHLAKGDPIDVANYCAFLLWHGWPTVALPLIAAQSAPDGVSVLVKALQEMYEAFSGAYMAKHIYETAMQDERVKAMLSTAPKLENAV